ncbi:MAG: SulP family inorganic anion transporter [Pirellulaceae bacterium]
MSQTNGNSCSAPRGDGRGFVQFIQHDILSGLLVFLIALPLCLAISLASGFPAIAGIFTAIIGAILTTFISNSELTIKGPAAGMIVIVLGCVETFGGNGANVGGWDAADMSAYQATLAVGVLAAVLQIFFGIFRAGILGEFFPSSAVHGMLAAIGVIIIIKQFPIALGVVGAKGEPLEMLQEFPHYIAEANPAIASIGITSLLIMFLWPMIGKRMAAVKKIPAALVVLIVAVPMGMSFNLLESHPYELLGHKYSLDESFLVAMPDRMFGMFSQFVSPDFSALREFKAWPWVFMFFAIGSLESLLSAKAVDLLDPWKRKTDLNRDMIAVGSANFCAAMVGGLPMISEIVRSKANIDSGARTRFADLWHGIFLLLCVALIPTILHRIPLAALAAMLVYTGFRLAHPLEFVHVYRIGREQFLIFVTTLVAVLATDLLVGIAIGIALKLFIHNLNGVPIKSMFKPFLEVEDIDERTSRIVASGSAVFSNWIPFRRQIEQIGLVQKRNLLIDLSDTNLVDHSTIEKLEEMQREFEQEGLTLELVGLDALQPLSPNAHAARRRGMGTVRRLTVIADESLEDWLVGMFVSHGATGFNSQACHGSGRHDIVGGRIQKRPQVRIEVIVTHEVSESILGMLQREVAPEHRITACIETVNVVRVGDFKPLEPELVATR